MPEGVVLDVDLGGVQGDLAVGAEGGEGTEIRKRHFFGVLANVDGDVFGHAVDDLEMR